MRSIDAFSLTTYPEEFVHEMLNQPAEGKKDLTVNAIMVHECGLVQEKQINIAAYRISFTDYVTILAADKKATYEASAGYSFSNYLKRDQLDGMELPVAYAGEFISSEESIRGNCYNSNTDTYGTAMGYCAFNVYLLYVYDIDRYVIVNERYMVV